MIHRRTILATAAATALAARIRADDDTAGDDTAGADPFTLKYAPHPGMFRHGAGEDVVDQIRFAAERGFRAFEYNGLPGESEDRQSEIGRVLSDHGMTMGVFVAYADFAAPTFARPEPKTTTEILDAMKRAVDIAGRVGATWFTVVPGSIDQRTPDNWQKYGGARLADGYQTANVIDLLRRCTEIIEPADKVMVLEPLNWHANHGGVFLRYSDQAYAICRAVNSPACKILFDIYHQQITEGNLIPNIDRCYDEIAYFQSGDNPGRQEPGTGEINYRNVFSHIRDKGYDGVIGMEHGVSGDGVEGEKALIEAYRNADA